MDTEKKDALHIEGVDNSDRQLASLANQEEHETGKLAALRQYPLACAWCFYSVFVILLSSFENQAAGIILGIPEFRKDFGVLYGDEYVIEAEWQAAFQGAPVASAVVGAIGAGFIADRIGRRPLFMASLAISFGAITMELLATTPAMFFGGKFLNGFSIGALQSVTISYIGEIVPLAVRGLFTCLSALSYTVGPLAVALIVKDTGTLESRWAYRTVFASQYAFAGVAAIFVFFMPESPWWLAGKDKDEKALRQLNKLGFKGDEGRKRLAVIKQTLAEIASETSGVTYLECFRKSNLRRTIISIAPLSIQSLSGIMFIAGYSTYYMQRAGFSTDMSFTLQIVQQVLSTVGNVASWYLVDGVGRRSLTFWGLFILTITLLVTGGLAVRADASGDIPVTKGVVSFILLYCFFYNATIGATAYTILAEVSTSRLRTKTVAIGQSVQNALNMTWSFVLPYLFNPDQANLGARISFIFGGLAALCLVYLWFYQPETAGRTYEELDEMFVKGVPAREFKAYQPEAKLRGEAVKIALDEKAQ